MKNPPTTKLMNEVVNILRDKGCNATAVQVRKYHNSGMFNIEGEKGKFRVFDDKALEAIETVYVLKIVDFSQKQIKTYLDLEREIDSNSLVEKLEVWDEVYGEYRYIRRVKAGVDKGTNLYRDLVGLIKDFDEQNEIISERLKKTVGFVKRGIAKFGDKKIGL